jgi:2-O-A-mannosyl-D-glycerate-specific PTS system IIC component
VQARFASRDEAYTSSRRLVALGKIADADAFLKEVFHRESLGPTALGEGLAVPHGKSAVVKEAASPWQRCANRWSGKAWTDRKRLS